MRLIEMCLIASLGAVSAACGSSTTVEETWRAPSASSLAFDKILVVAVSPTEIFRHKAEDQLARELRGAEVVRSYTLLPDPESLKDEANVDRVVAAHAIDGVVVLRVVSERTEMDYLAPSYPSSYYAYGSYYTPSYGFAPYYYDQGQLRTRQVVGVETTVYEARTRKLVWSGLTKTRDPDGTDDLLRETIAAVHQELRKEKLVP